MTWGSAGGWMRCGQQQHVSTAPKTALGEWGAIRVSRLQLVTAWKLNQMFDWRWLKGKSQVNIGFYSEIFSKDRFPEHSPRGFPCCKRFQATITPSPTPKLSGTPVTGCQSRQSSWPTRQSHRPFHRSKRNLDSPGAIDICSPSFSYCCVL